MGLSRYVSKYFFVMFAHYFTTLSIANGFSLIS